MKNIAFIICTIILLGCNKKAHFNKSDASEAVSIEMNDEQGYSENSNLSQITQPDNRKIIWSGNIEIKVKNVDQTTKEINTLTEKYGAFISEMRMTNTTYEVANTLTIRVKNDNFIKLIDAIKGHADYVKDLKIISNDVTEEYIDIKTRLKTKKEVRDRYIQLLKNKTGKISEVIEAEEAIRKITEEIEAKEGRLRYLNDKISFSTLTLKLFQKVSYRTEPSVYEKTFLDKAKQGLKNGWHIITGLIILLINIWPILIITIIIIWNKKWLRQKLFTKK